MSVEVGLWRVDGGEREVRRVDFTPMPDEAKLEAILADDLSILDPNCCSSVGRCSRASARASTS